MPYLFNCLLYSFFATRYKKSVRFVLVTYLTLLAFELALQ